MRSLFYIHISCINWMLSNIVEYFFSNICFFSSSESFVPLMVMLLLLRFLLNVRFIFWFDYEFNWRFFITEFDCLCLHRRCHHHHHHHHRQLNYCDGRCLPFSFVYPISQYDFSEWARKYAFRSIHAIHRFYS